MVVLILVEVKIPRPSNTFQTNFKVSGVTELLCGYIWQTERCGASPFFVFDRKK